MYLMHTLVLQEDTLKKGNFFTSFLWASEAFSFRYVALPSEPPDTGSDTRTPLKWVKDAPCYSSLSAAKFS